MKSMQGQGYKLRLGDGTTFSVDEKGLMTWLNGGLVDRKARIQPDGSKKWYSVQQVLAANAKTGRKGLEREDADRQAALEAAAIEKTIAKERAAEDRKAVGDAVVAERRAAEEARAAEQKAAEERAAAEAWAAAERAAAEARVAAEEQAARERAAEQERLDAERRAAEERAAEERRAAEARAEAEQREAAAREAARVAEAERLAAEELAERKRLAEEQKAAARREAEAKAAEERRAAEAKAAEALRAAEERLAEERRAAEAREAARIAEAERKAAEELAVRRRLADEQAARKRQAEEQKAAEERRAAEQAAAAQAAAAERRAAEQKRAADERRAAEEQKRAAEEEQRRAAEDRRAADARRAAEEAAALDALAPYEPPPTAPPVESVAAPPVARAPVAARPVAAPAERTFDGDVAAFHKELDLVPVGDPVAAPEIGIPARVAAPPAPRPVAFQDPTPEPTGADVLKTTVTELGSAVSRVFEAAGPATGSAAGWLARTTAQLRAAWTRTTAPAPRPEAPEPEPFVAPAPPPPVEPLAAAPLPVARPAVEAKPPAPVAPVMRSAPAPARPVASAATGPAPSTPPRSMPPPTFKDLPVIPFADAPNVRTRPSEAPAEDIYDGDDFEEPGSVGAALATAWRWTKRATIAAALIAGGAALAVNREAWLPRAKSDLTTLGGEVDRYASKALAKEIPPQAVEAASGEIPHMNPDTLRMVMARSGRGPLAPVDAFRRAYDAAEAGRASLGQAASEELDALHGLLAGELPDPAERERVKSYLARVRERAVTATYEDQEAMWLLARAARRFPSDRLARIQALLAQAVAAGLPPGA
jgi:hypothetical protein